MRTGGEESHATEKAFRYLMSRTHMAHDHTHAAQTHVKTHTLPFHTQSSAAEITRKEAAQVRRPQVRRKCCGSGSGRLFEMLAADDDSDGEERRQ